MCAHPHLSLIIHHQATPSNQCIKNLAMPLYAVSPEDAAPYAARAGMTTRMYQQSGVVGSTGLEYSPPPEVQSLMEEAQGVLYEGGLVPDDVVDTSAVATTCGALGLWCGVR